MRFYRLEQRPPGEPRMVLLRRQPRPGELLLCRARRAEMQRLIRLAEGRAHLATSTDRHIARALFAAIDRARDVVVDAPLHADATLAWLFRFREAVLRLERVARLG